MTDTHILSASPTSSLRAILERSMGPLLLFLAVLCGLLLLSWMLLLPRFTQLEVEGKKMGAGELHRYRQELQATLSTLEQHRTVLALPVQDPDFLRLMQQKQAHLTAQDVRSRLHLAAARVSDVPDAILLSRFSFDVASGAVEVEGDVRNVGPRSMTVLAAFIDQVEQMPEVSELTRPAFQRSDDGDGGFHSPFHFVFFVKQAVPPSL